MMEYESSGEVIHVTPTHAKIKELAEEFFAGHDNPKKKAYNLAWVTATAQERYERLCTEYEGQREDIAELLARYAFALAVAELYRSSSKFLIADKIGLVPTKLE